ncbi:MAG: hypothetical protein E6575_05840, partial [Bradyrhizobium sp.]|nr:hypothetical protein [Bradyrhizobium sp.]
AARLKLRSEAASAVMTYIARRIHLKPIIISSWRRGIRFLDRHIAAAAGSFMRVQEGDTA